MSQQVIRVSVNAPVAVRHKYGYSVVFVDDFFRYTRDDGQEPFQGVTGFGLRAVLRDEYEEAQSEGSKRDYYEDLWRNAVHEQSTTLGLDEWVAQIGDDEYESMRFDDSWSDHADEVRSIIMALPEWQQEHDEQDPEEAIPCTDADGCGRMFPLSDVDGVLNLPLYDLVSAWESGGMTDVEALTQALTTLGIPFTVRDRI